ncbi:MAG: type II secretion system protein GspK [Gammaproteobacteria bacterium]|nr:type II secretion system protein GspK [Gammaproteobacteria bacterium]
MKSATSQRGAVIIIVLWTAVLLTVLVTAMAARVRLSAAAAANNREASLAWAELMGAVSHAEMELMLERMELPVGEPLELSEDGEVLTPAYRFNGQALQLQYPVDSEVVVRIYDHAGKINLNRINRQDMQILLTHWLGGLDADPGQVQELLAAWTDWTDLNELEGVGGAETEYYEELENGGYTPRNNPELDSVDELLLIRGFGELLEGVNLEAAFTVYGNGRRLNLNLATREAMRLLPGLNEETIENIIAYREREDISNMAEIGEIVPFEDLQELAPWVGTNTSNIYTLFVYPRVELGAEHAARLEEEDEFYNPDPVTRGHMQILEVRGYNNPPIIHHVNPYGQLPDTAPARVAEEDLLFR